MKTTDFLLYIIYKIATNIIALGFAALLFKHIEVSDFKVLIFASIVLTILNMLVKPILLFISIPVVFFTLGLGYFLINAIILLITSSVVDGYHIDGLWTAIGASLLISFISLIFDLFAQSSILRIKKY